jgi:hypothetical protein
MQSTLDRGMIGRTRRVDDPEQTDPEQTGPDQTDPEQTGPEHSGALR